MKKTLISADTVRQAHAQGLTCLPAGMRVMVTPEARELAGKLKIKLDLDAADAAPTPASGACPPGDKPAASLRDAVIARLPPDVAKNPELVEQIVGKVCAMQRTATSEPQRAAPPPPAKACPAATAGKEIKLVKNTDIHLGVFPGAGTEKQVGIADVITAAEGSPIAAGFMAWNRSFFPWTLDYDEIDLVLEGELHIRCNGKTLIGKPGDVFYIPKGSAIEFGAPGMVRFFYVTYPANWQG